MRVKKILPYLSVLFFFLVPIIAEASIVRGGWSLDKIVSVINQVTNWLYIAGFAVAVIVIIIGGISYMTAGGNEDKQKSARKTIISGLIGAAIILLAGVILDTVANFFGISTPA